MPDILSTIKAIKLMWIKHPLKKHNKFSLITKQTSNIMDFKHYFSHNISKTTWQSNQKSFIGKF